LIHFSRSGLQLLKPVLKNFFITWFYAFFCANGTLLDLIENHRRKVAEYDEEFGESRNGGTFIFGGV